MGPELVEVVALGRILLPRSTVAMAATVEIMELVVPVVVPLKTDLILGKVGMVVVDMLM
jgi:biotin synthase-like enzyme